MSNFLKKILTERDNETFCVFKFAIFIGIIVLVIAHLYSTIHYGIVSGASFDPEKAVDIWKSFTETLAGLMGIGAGALKAKPVDNGTVPAPPSQG